MFLGLGSEPFAGDMEVQLTLVIGFKGAMMTFELVLLDFDYDGQFLSGRTCCGYNRLGFAFLEVQQLAKQGRLII